VLELRRKVVVEEDANIPIETAFLTVQTKDGRLFECHVTQSRGTMARPMSDAELTLGPPYVRLLMHLF
jgi:hypothetical protein